MAFEENLANLRAKTNELVVLNGINALLGWDQQVYMPEEAAQGRGEQMSLLGGIVHDKTTSPELGKVIEDLAAEIDDLTADDEVAREVRVAKRAFEQATKIPKEKMLEFIMATTLGQSAWHKAKVTNDFPSFQPHLQHIVELNRELANFFTPFDHPYDALLDMFEPGMKTAEVRAIFDALRPRQVALIKAIGEARQVDDSFRDLPYNIDLQRKISQYVSSLQGYDWQRGRIDETEHPFTTSLGFDDVRITTKYLERDMLSAFFSTMHEAGHALYDQGINPRYKGTALGSPASMAIHESQSRLWENLVGRSKEFWTFLYPTLQAFFPGNLGNVSLEQFYRGINKVTPSLIRTEADEATYNLHIMLRQEIEIDLLEGKINTGDLPEIWNQKMRDYLGVVPKDDTTGVLQDVHWSGGMFGYFPTYALGNLISAQWWHKLLLDNPNTPDEIAAGNLGNILAWLRTNVHQYGSRYDGTELVRKVTGEGINPDYYMDYLTKKYSEVYDL